MGFVRHAAGIDVTVMKLPLASRPTIGRGCQARTL